MIYFSIQNPLFCYKYFFNSYNQAVYSECSNQSPRLEKVGVHRVSFSITFIAQFTVILIVSVSYFICKITKLPKIQVLQSSPCNVLRLCTYKEQNLCKNQQKFYVLYNMYVDNYIITILSLHQQIYVGKIIYYFCYQYIVYQLLPGGLYIVYSKQFLYFSWHPQHGALVVYFEGENLKDIFKYLATFIEKNMLAFRNYLGITQTDRVPVNKIYISKCH
eukprot:TRINITY_DN13643_c0_g1_i6.p1 TRINITY_DN13643_c0_g1~~TRINITY_DN13643_c0_g1_i6.p1  ORF type:complete len:218 (+),score=-16.05 TRINITY_DN13643_c0_g1_i6:155-808(+)